MTTVEPSVVDGRFMIHVRKNDRPWIVIVEPDSDASLLVFVTAYEVRMTERSLQVTYRKGKPFSAYLHLSHQTGEKTARTVPSGDGLLVVDYGQNGKAIGVEINWAFSRACGSFEQTPRRTRRNAAERTRLPASASGVIESTS